MENTLTRDSIKYMGLSSPCKCSNCSFKLFNISNSFEINSQNSIIEKIVQVQSTISILNYKIIKTPKGTSYERFTLTGNKLFFKGHVNFNIQYISNNDINKLSIYKSNILFVESIQLPESYFHDSNVISLSPHIIDICTNKLNDKTIYLTFALYIDINF